MATSVPDSEVKVVKALTTLSSQIQLSQRATLKWAFDDLLGVVDSSTDKYRFLLGPMPDRHSPFGSGVAKTHYCTLTIDEVEYRCIATLEEIATALGRSVQMIRIYEKGLKYREDHSDLGPTRPHKLGKLYFCKPQPGNQVDQSLPSLLDLIRDHKPGGVAAPKYQKAY